MCRRHHWKQESAFSVITVSPNEPSDASELLTDTVQVARGKLKIQSLGTPEIPAHWNLCLAGNCQWKRARSCWVAGLTVHWSVQGSTASYRCAPNTHFPVYTHLSACTNVAFFNLVFLSQYNLFFLGGGQEYNYLISISFFKQWNYI